MPYWRSSETASAPVQIPMFEFKVGIRVITLKPQRCTVSSVQPVESARVVAKDLALYLGRDIRSILENFNCVDVARSVGMAVVRADHQTVFAGFTHHVWDVIAIFAGHVHAKRTKWILGPSSA